MDTRYRDRCASEWISCPDVHTRRLARSDSVPATAAAGRKHALPKGREVDHSHHRLPFFEQGDEGSKGGHAKSKPCCTVNRIKHPPVSARVRIYRAPLLSQDTMIGIALHYLFSHDTLGLPVCIGHLGSVCLQMYGDVPEPWKDLSFRPVCQRTGKGKCFIE